MLINPKDTWKYAFNPLKVVAIRNERDYRVLYLEGGGEICVSDMSFCELLKLINHAQSGTTQIEDGTGA